HPSTNPPSLAGRQFRESRRRAVWLRCRALLPITDRAARRQAEEASDLDRLHFDFGLVEHAQPQLRGVLHVPRLAVERIDVGLERIPQTFARAVEDGDRAFGLPL